MDKYEILKEAVSEKAFGEEPLALALLYCLEKQGIIEHSELIEAFDKIIENRLQLLINEQKANNHAGNID